MGRILDHPMGSWQQQEAFFHKFHCLVSQPLLPRRPELTSLSSWAWLIQLKSLETLTDPIFISHDPLDQTEKRNEILVPSVESLKKERTKFPFTGTLETISSCYIFFSLAMGKEQYEPIDALSKSENRLFTQFHGQYPLEEKGRIIDGLTLG